MVGGGIAGSAGGVGDAAGDPDVVGATPDDVETATDAGSLPSHAASGAASTHTHTEMRTLRNWSTPETGRERLEDTDSCVP
jgi:hypothetical protein